MAPRLHPHQELLPLVWVTKGKEPYSARLLPSLYESKNGEPHVHVHWDEADYDQWVPVWAVELASDGRRSNNRKRGGGKKEGSNIASTKERSVLEALGALIDLVANAERASSLSLTDDQQPIPEPVLSSVTMSAPAAKPVGKNVSLHVTVTERKEPYAARLLPVQSVVLHGKRNVRVHWDLADYKAWVPAFKVEIVSEGRRSRKRAQDENVPDKMKEQRVLDALLGLIHKANEQEQSERLSESNGSATATEPPTASSTTAELDTKMEHILSSPRRREASLLSDSLAETLEPTFDNRGHRPRKTPARYAREPSPPSRPETHEGGPWTDQEVRMLLQAVKEVGQPTNWNEVALRVPGRSFNSCSMKFLKMKRSKKRAAPSTTDYGKPSPSHASLLRVDKPRSVVDSTTPTKAVKPAKWTEEEDAILRQNHAAFGNDFDRISRSLPFRTDRACANRLYLLHLQDTAYASRDDCEPPASRSASSRARKPGVMSDGTSFGTATLRKKDPPLMKSPKSGSSSLTKSRAGRPLKRPTQNRLTSKSAVHGTRREGEPWTDEEIDLLLRAVKAVGKPTNWYEVALLVPGRSYNSCSMKFLKIKHQIDDDRWARVGKRVSLSTPTKAENTHCANSKWTEEEDAILRQKHEAFGSDFALISQFLPSRTRKACESRFYWLRQQDAATAGLSSWRLLDPPGKSSVGSKIEWSQEELSVLRQKHAEFGNQWRLISQSLPGRSEKSCRTRFVRLIEGSNAGGGLKVDSGAKKRRRNDDWTEQEDTILKQRQRILGNKWKVIAQSLPRRSNEDCRSRFVKLNPRPTGSSKTAGLRFSARTETREERFTAHDIWLIRNYVPKLSPYM